LRADLGKNQREGGHWCSRKDA